jgi:hypothetical protein
MEQQSNGTQQGVKRERDDQEGAASEFDPRSLLKLNLEQKTMSKISKAKHSSVLTNAFSIGVITCVW